MNKVQIIADAGTDDADAYIGLLADRIKAIRVRRGMTRKLLSAHSKISERYLSQVESGRANISVALLWRIAHALDVPIAELLPDAGSKSVLPAPLLRMLKQLDADQLDKATALLQQMHTQPTQKRGVALIGLRGAGKSELGRMLGRRVGVPFVDLVAVAESLSGMEVGELFSLGGQKAYRRAEYQALNHVLENYPRAIVEAGGSLVTQVETYRRLRNNYHTIWLKADPVEHMERVIAQGDLRPMQGNLSAMDDLKRILAEREKEYEAAHYILDTAGRDVRSCFDELLEQAGRYL